MTVVVKIFGPEPPCAKCRAVEKIAKEVAEEIGGVEVVKVSALSEEADKYGILVTPAVVINDELVFSGKVPTKEELRRAIQKAAQGAV